MSSVNTNEVILTEETSQQKKKRPSFRSGFSQFVFPEVGDRSNRGVSSPGTDEALAGQTV